MYFLVGSLKLQKHVICPHVEMYFSLRVFNNSVCVFLQVHREAVYYNIKPLTKRLEETPRLFGELVGRQQFLSRVPHYKENIEVNTVTSESIAVLSLVGQLSVFTSLLTEDTSQFSCTPTSFTCFVLIYFI